MTLEQEIGDLPVSLRGLLEPRDRAAAECRLGAEHPPGTCLHIWLAERPAVHGVMRCGGRGAEIDT